MTDNDKPLILLTNDDGVDSPGLWALVESLYDFGTLLVVAPNEQQSSVGTSMSPASSGCIYKRMRKIHDTDLTLYGVDGQPVQAVQHGVFELASRLPDLVVSGINYGENIGANLIVSGTIGAALEAAVIGIPVLAVSKQVSESLQYTQSQDVDFAVAAGFARRFARWVLNRGLPDGVDVLKIDVPDIATVHTEWRMTRVSRFKRYRLEPPKRENLADPGSMRKVFVEMDFEADSDVRAIYYDKVVSVTPMCAHLTSNVNLDVLKRQLLDIEQDS